MDTGHGTTITKTESRGRPHDADFTEYVAARQGQMLRFAYLLTGQRAEAEDLLQTAFAKLYLAWGKVGVESSRDAYVRTILVRENASTWRRLWRRREQSVGELTDGSAVDAGFVSSPHESFVDRSLMWQCVCALPPKQRAAVVLRYYEDLSEKATAEILGVSVGTVKSSCSAALRALRTSITASEGGPR